MLAATLAACWNVALGGLQDEIAAAVAEAGCTSRAVSVAVRDCRSGDIVAGISSSTPRIPASNQKLVTSGMAARVLGADFRFETRLLRRGNDLIVAGDGDPALADDALLADMRTADGGTVSATDLLDIWAAAAASSGVRHVETLIIDDRVFDRVWRPAGWPRDQLHRRYCAPVSGLNFSCNTMSFRPAPGGGGVDVSDAWPDWGGIRIVNKLKRGRKGRDTHVVHGSHQPDRGGIVLTGTVVEPTIAPVEIAVEEPPQHFGMLLAARLAASGIQVDEVRLASETDPPAAGELVAPPITTSLETVMRRCNHDSYNLYADAMFKRVAHETTGRPGSWEDGARVITRTVEQIVGPDTGLTVVDGSGMSRLNTISARAMTEWLCSFDPSSPDDAFFIASLSRPGEGKMHKRFREVDLHGAEVRAKSGYLRSVYALSGYVTCQDGHRFAFSILINDPPRKVKAKRLQDEIVSLIATQCDGG
jgi:D-alanyl-D-alanine carboxypeptidase/D-alanyl-D-alanine-endopeptidase (penicillin-binding protein 4)